MYFINSDITLAIYLAVFLVVTVATLRGTGPAGASMANPYSLVMLASSISTG